MDGVMQYMHEFYFETAAMILALITVGKMLEARSKGKTTDALKNLMKLFGKFLTDTESKRINFLRPCRVCGETPALPAILPKIPMMCSTNMGRIWLNLRATINWIRLSGETVRSAT